MRKAVLIATVVAVAILAVCLLPHRQSRVDAYQENLWTSTRHGWASPVAQGREMEVIQWDRTEYGIQWAWLVVDREAGGEAWSARMEPKAVLIYLLASGLAGIASVFAIYRMRTRTGEMDKCLPLLVAIAVLLLCLLPHRRSMKTAYQDNLWTGGGWGRPAPTAPDGPDLMTWNRTQYGIKWAWLVTDRQVGGKAWFARMESKAIMVYLVPACGLAGAVYLLGRRRKPLVSR